MKNMVLFLQLHTQSFYVRIVFLGGIAGLMKGAVFTLSACMSFWAVYVVVVSHVFPG